MKAINNLSLLIQVRHRDTLYRNIVVKLLLTACSGIQEESTILGFPGILLRINAERPVRLRNQGRVNVLVKNDTAKLE